ncbi:hypothetical protein ACWD9K_35445 [Streptomyces sp. 900116325]
MTVSRGKNQCGKDLARRGAAVERVAADRKAAEEAEAEQLRNETAIDEPAADIERTHQHDEAVAPDVEEVRHIREQGPRQAPIHRTRRRHE